MAQRGKSSTGWFFGFKLHLIINDRSELLGVRLTPGNVDDRLPVPEMAKGLFGKLFGDRGYISQALRDTLKQQGVELITKLRKNMKPKLLNLMDKILLRKRALIETVNDQLKNVCQIEHSRHRSPINAFVHLIAGLVAFTWQEKRPALSWTPEEFDQTEGTIFTDKVLLSIYVLFTGVNFYDTLHRVKDQWLGEKASSFVWGEPEL